MYYMPEAAEKLWDISGENTDYVIVSEECMAENMVLP